MALMQDSVPTTVTAIEPGKTVNVEMSDKSIVYDARLVSKADKNEAIPTHIKSIKI